MGWLWALISLWGLGQFSLLGRYGNRIQLQVPTCHQHEGQTCTASEHACQSGEGGNKYGKALCSLRKIQVAVRKQVQAADLWTCPARRPGPCTKLQCCPLLVAGGLCEHAGTLRSESEVRGTLRFLPHLQLRQEPQLEMRPSSNAPNPVECREAPPTSSFPDFSEPP